jgi:putative transposase
MANTFTSLHYHITFSTKRRERWLAPNVEEGTWEYLGGTAKTIGMQPHRVGGEEFLSLLTKHGLEFDERYVWG